MKKSNLPQNKHEYLPWAVNQTLPPAESREVEDWLNHQPAMRSEMRFWRDIQSVVLDQPELEPSPKVAKELSSRIRMDREARQVKRNRRIAQTSGVAAALAIFWLLWLIIKPGITLNWSVYGSTPEVFKVYRSEFGRHEQHLIAVIPAQDSRNDYQFTDLWMIPGKTYTYWVEGSDWSGATVFSRPVISNSLPVVPGQIGILLASLILGYIICSFSADTFRIFRTGSQGGMI